MAMFVKSGVSGENDIKPDSGFKSPCKVLEPKQYLQSCEIRRE